MHDCFHREFLYHVQLRHFSNVHPYVESDEPSPHMVTCRIALRDGNLRTDPSFQHSRKTLRSAHCDRGIQSTPPPVRKVNSICAPALHSQGGPMYDGSCHRPAESRRGEEPASSSSSSFVLVVVLAFVVGKFPTSRSVARFGGAADFSHVVYLHERSSPSGRERVPRVTAFFTARPSIVLFDPSSAYIT